MDGERLFLDRIELIDRITRFVARRHRLDPAEAEEFQSIVRLKLIEDDYRILRQFQQRSALSTFLATVINRLFLDYRVSLWGKWRPSAEARRAGPIAVRLEMLMGRDGLSFDEACEVLTVTERVDVSPAALHGLRLTLPVRSPRRFVSDELLAERVDPGVDLESRLIDEERAAAHQRVRSALAQAMDELPAQDRLILQMRFEQGLTIAQVARALRLDAKPLYRRIERLLAGLRRTLEAQGFEADEVMTVVGRADLAERPEAAAGIGGTDPSLFKRSGA
jgi:RNA polymerase sigma factor for flagellar operon FliA